MDSDPLDALLVKLSEGDTDAAAAVFRTYGPILRMVVRRQLSDRLRSKFDSLDVVQSVWVDFLRGFQEVGWRFDNAARTGLHPSSVRRILYDLARRLADEQEPKPAASRESQRLAEAIPPVAFAPGSPVD